MKSILELLALFLVFQVSNALLLNRKTDLWSSKQTPEFQTTMRKINNFSASNSSEENVVEKWIEQRLNNFDPQDNRTFMMRYMENSNYLQDGGPIFIFIGEGWTIDADTLRYGHMSDMAKALNETMFYTEQRFFGESRPTADLSTENLRFLQVDQALADLAHFIVHVKAKTSEFKNSGVILVGMSMVTWFVQKYPHLANGAWSSSSPLEAMKDFVGYKEGVSEAIHEIGGENCSSRIKSAFEELESLILNKEFKESQKLFISVKTLTLKISLMSGHCFRLWRKNFRELL